MLTNINLKNSFALVTTISYLVAVYLCLFLVGSGCAKKENIPQAADTLITPCQEVGASTMYAYNGPHLIWILDSDYSFRTLDDTSSMLVVPVRLSIFDTVGQKTTRILSDSGRTAKEMARFFIWGNVFIKNWDGLIIKSQSLWWDKPTRMVGSDDFVEIRTPDGDVLRGKGLDATESFSWWSLRKKVSGTFPNFKERMGSDEEF